MSAVRDSTMPPEVAAYFDRQQEEVRKRFGAVQIHGFARVGSLAELERLSARDFLVSYLEGHAPDPAQHDDRRPPQHSRRVIGAVAEGDSLAHVVYRDVVDVGRFGTTEQVAVLPVKRFAGGWRVLLNDDLAALSGASVRVLRERGDE